MDYDVLILGGGLVGCAAAYELSKYSLNIALIERDYDIADDLSQTNTAMVYDGSECSDTLMAKLENKGNTIIEQLASRFKVPFKKCGSLVIAQDKEEEAEIVKIFEASVSRGIENIYLLDSDEVYKLEQNLNIGVKKAIYSKNTGVICPYDLALSYAEIAFDNGVNFKLEEEVIDIQKNTKGFKVITNKNKFTCAMVINTTLVRNYTEEKEEFINKSITNLNYLLLEKDCKGSFKRIVSTMNHVRDRVYTLPTVQGNTIVAVNSDKKMDYDEVKVKVASLVGILSEENINSFYKAPYYNNRMIIDDSLIDEGYVKVIGKNYAQVTMAPYIAKIVCETAISNLKCVLKKDYIDKRRDFYRFRDMNNEQRNKLIKIDKRYGRIICTCNMVSEGEIVDAIRRPLGARTIEGIRRRTGAASGNCQGAYCLDRITEILANETNKKMTEIVKDSKNSKILVSRIKVFNEM